MRKTISVSTSRKHELVDITGEVQSIVSSSGVKTGVCSIFVPHATAAVTINENADPNIKEDILKSLSDNVPQGKWLHDRIDGNAAAHIKASIIGPSEIVPFNEGKLMLGTWQDIFLCDFDGPKDRKIIIDIISGESSGD